MRRYSSRSRTWREQTQWRYAAFPRPRDNRSPAASEGRYRGSDLAVTAPERPRRWPGSPCGCPAVACARRRSRWPDRGRLGRCRGQLHRISHRSSRKLAHVSGKTAFVRFLPGILGHPAGGGPSLFLLNNMCVRCLDQNGLRPGERQSCGRMKIFLVHSGDCYFHVWCFTGFRLFY